jgi:osmoprotectant transport system substrate-binding protein
MVVGEEKLSSIDEEAFMAVVDAVNEELTEDAMVAMNAEVTEGRDDSAVAVSFLRNAGLMEPIDRG